MMQIWYTENSKRYKSILGEMIVKENHLFLYNRNYTKSNF